MKNTIFLTISALIEKGAGFAFLSLMAYNFGKLEVGKYSYFFALANILFILFNVGGDIYNIKYFTKHKGLDIIFNIVLSKFLLFGIVAFALLFYDRSPQLLILLLSFFLESIISIIRSHLFTSRKFKLHSSYLIFEKIIFVSLLFLCFVSFNHALFFYSSFVISKLSTICICLFKERFKISRHRFSVNLNLIKDYIIDSWSYILHTLLVILFVKLGIIMMRFFGIGYEQIALYSSSYNLIVACLILPDVLFKQYYPTATKYVHNKEILLLSKLATKVQFSSTTFSIIITTTIALFSKEIITLIFSNSFVDAAKILILLSTVIITRFPLRIYSAILASSDYNYYRLITSVSCALLNLILNVIFIPKWGLNGAVYSTIITEFFLYILYKYFSLKITKSNFFSRHELIMLLQLTLIISIFVIKEIPFSIKLIYIIATVFSILLFRKKIKLLLTY